MESPQEYFSSERRREHFGLGKHLLASPVHSSLSSGLIRTKKILAFVVLTAVDSKSSRKLKYIRELVQNYLADFFR